MIARVGHRTIRIKDTPRWWHIKTERRGLNWSAHLFHRTEREGTGFRFDQKNSRRWQINCHDCVGLSLHWIGRRRPIRHDGKLLSLIGVSDKGCMKKNDRDMTFSLIQSNKGQSLYVRPSNSSFCCCTSDVLLRTWIQTLGFFNLSNCLTGSRTFSRVCIYSASPLQLEGRKEKKTKHPCPFGVYRIKDEVNIISITFEPVNHQHSTEKRYCKRLTMPMRLELCDLPLRQRGGRQAKTWEEVERSTALSLHHFSKQPPRALVMF